jgi:hypothetical protein
MCIQFVVARAHSCRRFPFGDRGRRHERIQWFPVQPRCSYIPHARDRVQSRTAQPTYHNLSKPRNGRRLPPAGFPDGILGTARDIARSLAQYISVPLLHTPLRWVTGRQFTIVGARGSLPAQGEEASLESGLLWCTQAKQSTALHRMAWQGIIGSRPFFLSPPASATNPPTPRQLTRRLPQFLHVLTALSFPPEPTIFPSAAQSTA